MNRRRSEDRLYPAVLLAFLVGLVSLGLLGVPALLVAAIGAAVASLAIALFFHGALGRGRTPAPRGRRRGPGIPDKYVPSVLEGSRTKRRRLAPLRRHRNASPPLRFR
jgi:hypothetical protein